MEIELASAHIWLTPVDDIPDYQVSEFETILAPDELDRATRFVFSKDRKLFIIARAHIRRILSQYARVSPEAWQFRKGAFGRPLVANRYEGPELYFSLSHTHGMVASVISLTELAGIDAEDVERQSDYAGLAKYVFSAAEYECLLALQGKARRRRFYELWTLKEAYSKARSAGLSIGIDRVSFDTSRDKITASFQAPLNDNPDHWHFELIRPNLRHQLGLAVKQSGPSKLRSEIRLFRL